MKIQILAEKIDTALSQSGRDRLAGVLQVYGLTRTKLYSSLYKEIGTVPGVVQVIEDGSFFLYPTTKNLEIIIFKAA